MSTVTVEMLDALVADGAITEEQAAAQRAKLEGATRQGSRAAQEAQTQARKNRQQADAAKVADARESGVSAKLPKMPAALSIGMADSGKVYAVTGETHYGKDGERKLRAVPVVTVTPRGGKAISITADLLKILDAKRGEIDAMLAWSSESLAALRGVKVAAGANDGAEVELI